MSKEHIEPTDEEMERAYAKQAEHVIQQHRLAAEMWATKAAACLKLADYYRLRADVEAGSLFPNQAEIENDLTYARWEEEAAAHCKARAAEARKVARQGRKPSSVLLFSPQQKN